MIPDPDLDAVKSEIETHIRGSVILSLNPDPESDFKPFGDSESGFRSSKKRHCNTSISEQGTGQPNRFCYVL